MDDDAAMQIRLRQPRPHPLRIRRLGQRVADQMQRRGVVVEGAKSLEQLQDALALEPVADAQKRGASALAQVAWRWPRGLGDVPAGRHDPDPLGGLTSLAKILGERIAGHQQAIAASLVGQAVQPGLERRAQRPVVDSAWRLVQHADHRQWRLAKRKPGAAEGGGDAVQDKYFGTAAAHVLHHGGTVEDRQREGAVGNETKSRRA